MLGQEVEEETVRISEQGVGKEAALMPAQKAEEQNSAMMLEEEVAKEEQEAAMILEEKLRFWTSLSISIKCEHSIGPIYQIHFNLILGHHCTDLSAQITGLMDLWSLLAVAFL